MKKRYLLGFLTACLWCTGMLSAQTAVSDTLKFVFKLHGQTRRYQVVFCQQGENIQMNWGIERNLHWQSGSYTMTPEALKNGKQLCFLQPKDGNHLTLSFLETAYVLPQSAWQQLKEKGSMEFNRTVYDRVADESEKNTGRPLLHVVDRHEGGEMWIWDNPSLPVVWRMKNNPLEINWQVEVK